MRSLILLAVFGMANANASYAENWEFVKKEEGITVDRIIPADSPVVMFRGRTTMNAPISALMAVVLDYRTQKEWNNTGYDMRVLQKNSDTDMFFYSALHVPWPFKDRDFVINLHAVVLGEQRTVEIHCNEASHAAAPPQPKRVRLPVARVHWRFVALTENKTQVTVTFQIDAGGVLPLWLMNRVTKGMPFRGLRNIRDVIREGKYDRVFEKKFFRYNSLHG
jgi:hypothetical protein